jgi:TM2 domain-containing membrane protein YozV
MSDEAIDAAKNGVGMSEDHWWYVVAGRQAGPITWADLQQRAREGLLRPGDPVWHTGLGYWVAAGNTPGLFAPGSVRAMPHAVPPMTPTTPTGKTRITAAIFAILLGSFGAHKFYMGDTALGVIYLLFFWTGIPGLIGLIEGIVYLTKSDQEFAAQYK